MLSNPTITSHDDHSRQIDQASGLIREAVPERLAKQVVHALRRLEDRTEIRFTNPEAFYKAVQKAVLYAAEKTHPGEHTEITITEAVVSNWRNAMKEREEQADGIVKEFYALVGSHLDNVIQLIKGVPSKTENDVLEFLNSPTFWYMWYDVAVFFNALSLTSISGVARVIERQSRNPVLKEEIGKMLERLYEVDGLRMPYSPRKPNTLDPSMALRDGFA